MSEQRTQPMTADSIEAAFEEWRHTLTIKDNPSNEQIFGQGYVAGWNAKEVLVDPDYILPCDVHLPPATRITKGCKLSTLLTALRVREGTAFPSADRG